MIRIAKLILVVFVGLQGLFYFISNAVNWDAANAAVGAILSQIGNQVYANPIIPADYQPGTGDVRANDHHDRRITGRSGLL